MSSKTQPNARKCEAKMVRQFTGRWMYSSVQDRRKNTSSKAEKAFSITRRGFPKNFPETRTTLHKEPAIARTVLSGPAESMRVLEKMGFVSQVGLQRLLLQSFKYYLYGGDVPCILAITDNLRAQVHMFRQAALEEAVIHHLSHVNGSADGSSTSL